MKELQAFGPIIPQVKNSEGNEDFKNKGIFKSMKYYILIKNEYMFSKFFSDVRKQIHWYVKEVHNIIDHFYAKKKGT